jgi:hypothetical protein
MIVGSHGAAGEQEQSQGKARLPKLPQSPELPKLPTSFYVDAFNAGNYRILAILAIFSHRQAPPSFLRLTSCPSSNESAGFITT